MRRIAAILLLSGLCFPAAAQDLTTSPSTRPASPPATTPLDLNFIFLSDLKLLLEGHPVTNRELAGLAARDQRTFAAILGALGDFSSALARTNSLPAAIEPLVAMADNIRAQVPLRLSHSALCTRVTGFGVYDELDAPLPAMRPTNVVLYCEVEGFHSRVGERATYETRLTQNVSLLDADGKPLWQDHPSTMVDACRNLRRDFFLARVIKLPGKLPAGQYTLKIEVADQFSGESAQAELLVEVAAVP